MRSYHIFRTWAVETMAIALAAGLVASIASVLAFYNGDPVPDWGANLNLNALLALLSTILRALLVIIAAQIISQRKWDWFSAKHARPLADLQQFDYGSRGAFGALLLIPTVFFKDLVTLAAAIVILVSFLVGPFVQQASGTTPCSFPGSGMNASLPFAHWVPRSGSYWKFTGDGEVMVGPGLPTPEIIAAIISSVVSPYGIENQISITCATGNCTFGDLIPEGSQDTVFNDNNRTGHATVGVCNMCTNVASLVTSKNLSTPREPWLRSLRLPNGFNITTGAPSYIVATMNPTPDLTWMGNLLTDSVREASRWAYVNATLLNAGRDPATASVCSLYPCLRTYNSIIKDNQLHEKEIQSDVMRIQLHEQETQSDVMRIQPAGASTYTFNDLNASSNFFYDYASVKSPCRVEGRTFHEGDALPHGMATMDLQLLETKDEKYTLTNVTWPKQCIYRQYSHFVRAIATVMNTDIFGGYCDINRGNLTCSKYGEATESYLSGVGVDAILRPLLSGVGVNAERMPLIGYEGNSAHENVTTLFNAIANAMTNRFRFQYGSEDARDSSMHALPLDLVRGKAWETKVCVSVRIKWLLFPICLTLITSILSMWTIITNWQRRHSIPVWKESILPLLFYGQNIKPQDSKALPMQPFGKDAGEDQTEGLMEVSTMAAASRDIMVTFRWPDSEKTDELDDQRMSSTASLLGQDSIPLRRLDSRGSSVVYDH